MRALVYDPDALQGLRLGEAPDPQPEASQVLVEVHATSLNFGEVAFLLDRAKPGDIAGWDAAGTVITAAADGSGPSAGARVVAFGWGGAWAQRRVVDTAELAVLPDAVEFAAAAALPVERGAGLPELGAAEVAVGIGGLTGTFDGALDNVGGQMLADVYSLLGPDASAMSIGMASLEPTTIDFEAGRIQAAELLLGRKVRGKAVLEVAR